MESLLILPLVVIVGLCAWVIWRGLRKPKPPAGQAGDPSSLNGGPDGGGTPR